jgi:hypothetical protein
MNDNHSYSNYHNEIFLYIDTKFFSKEEKPELSVFS